MKEYQGKRLFDLILTIFLLIVFSPLFVLIFLVVLFMSGWPVFFYQKRLGFKGKVFNIIKFRTMIKGAEKLEDKVAAEFDLQPNFFYLADDPRQTKPGRLLRAMALDELPQLINVIKGDMSLVGPRPLPVGLREEEFINEKFLLEMRPGITGLYQLYTRRKRQWGSGEPGGYREKIFLDKRYFRNMSFGFDLKIILATSKTCFLSLKSLIRKSAR